MKPAVQKKPDATAFNILSYIRVRPLNEREKKTTHLQFNRRDVTVKNNISKVLSFDKVFEEESKQVAVYNTVMHPMIREVLQGYNCTVFAYGQTGTGKTYTMTGHQASVGGSLAENAHAGLIPRAMEEIFKELSLQRSEYHVSVQYLELYNEKLRSLLSDTQEENIQLISDLEGAVTIKGIPSTPVKSKDEAFKLLLQGADRKQMATTTLNENSSRSHTIFIITVKMRENMPSDQEDILRVGKLYLVDLAGSENVSRSGANDVAHKTSSGVNKRLAEASNINKSLLTLGRVITALTENSSHIPYRESKLTRILGDSLGGRTKTAIIATVSPSQANIDETESTLNYASKARAIKNKPEKNQTISKKEFMQFASEEILKLKRDLEATRQGDGFYITQESHEDMCNNMRALENQVKDWNDRYERLNTSYNEKQAMFESLNIDFDEKCAEYEELDQIFKAESAVFSEKLKEVEKGIIVREFLIKEFENTESKLTQQAKSCKTVIENLADQSEKLHEKIDRTKVNESSNSQILDTFKSTLKNDLKEHEGGIEDLFNQEEKLAKHLLKFSGNVLDKVHDETEMLSKICGEVQSQLLQQRNLSESAQNKMKSVIEEQMAEHRAALRESNSARVETLETLLIGTVEPAFDQVAQHVSALKTLLVQTSQDFKQVKNKQNDLMLKAKATEESFKHFSTRIMVDFSKLKGMIEDSWNKSKEHSEEEKLLIQKTKKILEFQEVIKKEMEELHCMQESSLKTTLENENNFNHCFKHSNQIETTLKTSTDKLAQENAASFNQMSMLLNENDEKQQEIFSEAVNKINGFNVEKERIVQNLSITVADKVASLKDLSQSEETNCENLIHSLAHYSSDLINGVKSSLQLSNDFANQIESELKQSEEKMSSLIREQHTNTQRYMSQVQESTRGISKSLSNLGNNVEAFTYNPYLPTGQTPQRFNRKDLNYPTKFATTAPRDVLIEKFRSQQNETVSSPNPTIPLFENAKTPLKNSNKGNQIVKSSRSKTTPKLRRSLSVNDLVEEDKENRRITCSRSANRQDGKKVMSKIK